MTFAYWDDDQPEKNWEFCVGMQRKNGWKWHDHVCGLVVKEFKYPFICQFGKIV